MDPIVAVAEAKRSKRRFASLWYRFQHARLTYVCLSRELRAKCHAARLTNTPAGLRDLRIYSFVTTAAGFRRLVPRPPFTGGAEHRPDRGVIRVLLVHRYELTRLGIMSALGSELDIEILGDAVAAQDAPEKVAASRPEVVLLETAADGSGAAATRSIKARCRDTRILWVTHGADPRFFREAIEAGAEGCLACDITPRELAAAIRFPTRTGTCRSAPRPEGSVPTGHHTDALTARQVDILRDVAAGLSNKEIGAKLFLTEITVKGHLRRIYERLNVRNRAQAAVIAVNGGLLGQFESNGQSRELTSRPVSVRSFSREKADRVFAPDRRSVGRREEWRTLLFPGNRRPSDIDGGNNGGGSSDASA